MTVATLHTNEIALNFAEISDIGGRQTNQDAQRCAIQDDFAIFVVADGAGGHEGGEIAAKTVVDSVIASFEKNHAFAPEAMHAHIEAAIVGVQEAKETQPNMKDMSATAAGVMLDLKNGLSLWAHMGDTRVYLFRRSKVQKITKDHSIAQQFVDAGFWAYDSIRNHPQRNRLFAAIGSEGDTQPEITEAAIPFIDGDVFLVCTDGFWEWATENDMEQALAESTSADEWLHKLCDTIADKANAAGKSRDNCTAYAIWLGEPEIVTITR
jgi:serine/threonine protein phosphatase PrpC